MVPAENREATPDPPRGASRSGSSSVEKHEATSQTGFKVAWFGSRSLEDPFSSADPHRIQDELEFKEKTSRTYSDYTDPNRRELCSKKHPQKRSRLPGVPAATL
ncbi:hypothetical protein ATANTOWER_011863 [Ataeniobius toweri]|uniref:Uncharacterized protein n=1 Tax=Ataeniobius toweri TaxID=208326 RepID=A0ABU7B1A5_9TELE|nr:hypothetical protein [Ataeniobius toweri]